MYLAITYENKFSEAAGKPVFHHQLQFLYLNQCCPTTGMRVAWGPRVFNSS